ncbi:Bug family tripartite tricarboxylate transporter substrate binding protein [Noviherbaspirillum aerium]|uniref:Bug family tripartite tricarboxylate transporter substrate binding protein n=1 Tax=Noviherbaspirillum aerium TaxID=2588497 RepID=UPI00178C7FEE|nr:tripartite tricarboxylate transporter substrate binding protein [Noviherbaspirillum aerium]
MAQVQTFPTRPIKFVVPFAPGGATDLVARTLADRLQTRLGQPVLTENKPGASTMIGANTVAKSAADGYTLLLSGSSTYSVLPALKTGLPYDYKKDLVPVAIVANAPLVLVTGAETPASSLADLVGLAKAKPETLTYSTFGPGSAPHIATEMLSQEAGIKLTAIPYKGCAPAVMAVLSGEINMAVESISAVKPHIKSGKLKALAVLHSTRSTALPDVPTMAELNYPRATFEAWYGIAAPNGTPAPVLQVLKKDLSTILAMPDVIEKLQASSLEPVMLDSQAFASKIQTEVAKYSALGKRANISLD